MISSSIYNFIQMDLAPKDSKHYQPMENSEKRAYFKCPVPATVPFLLIASVKYPIIEQHISIYKKFNDSAPGLEAWHLTATVAPEPAAPPFVIHFYFQLDGRMKGITMKRGDTYVDLSEADQKALKEYALKNSNLIFKLNDQLLEKYQSLKNTIENKYRHVEELSRNWENSLTSYTNSIRALISLIKELNFIFNNDMRSELNGLETLLSTCEEKLSAKAKAPVKKTKHKKITAPKESKRPLDEKKEAPASSSSTTSTVETDELENINKQLAALNKDDLATLKKRKELLERKTSMPTLDFQDTIDTFQALYRVNHEINEKLLALALNGDIASAREIIETNRFVPPYFYSELIEKNHTDVFDILFKASTFQMILKNHYYHMGGKDGMLVPRKSFLHMAYDNKNEDFFRKLLFEYRCDPTAVIPTSGKQLIHIFAAEGAINYMQMLFDAGVDINTLSSKPRTIRLFINPTTGSTQILDVSLHRSSSEEKEKKKTTPLIEAVCHLKIEMVRWLLEHNVEVMKPISEGKSIPLDCLVVIVSKIIHAKNKEEKEKASHIMGFLLNQDVSPLTLSSLKTAFGYLTSSTQTELDDISNKGKLMLEKRDFNTYLSLMQNFISKHTAPIKDILINITKATLINAAEKDLENGYQRCCLNACNAILYANFTTEQYNERLWAARYQAFLSLSNHERACEALETYLSILNQKLEKMRAPQLRENLQTKIEGANKLLIEVRRKIPPAAAISATFFTNPETESKESLPSILPTTDFVRCGGRFAYRHK